VYRCKISKNLNRGRNNLNYKIHGRYGNRGKVERPGTNKKYLSIKIQYYLRLQRK
jgi:hypothetical protein